MTAHYSYLAHWIPTFLDRSGSRCDPNLDHSDSMIAMNSTIAIAPQSNVYPGYYSWYLHDYHARSAFGRLRLDHHDYHARSILVHLQPGPWYCLVAGRFELYHSQRWYFRLTHLIISGV